MVNNVDTTSSSGYEIKTREEVIIFLNQVKLLLDDDSSWEINNCMWAGNRVNKTQLYLAEKNLSDDDVANVIRELQVCNYCYTEDDRNSNFPNEQFWFFGITRLIVDVEEDYYIKLKIRKFEDDYLLVMSFHPEQPKCPEDRLAFPYGK